MWLFVSLTGFSFRSFVLFHDSYNLVHFNNNMMSKWTELYNNNKDGMSITGVDIKTFLRRLFYIINIQKHVFKRINSTDPYLSTAPILVWKGDISVTRAARRRWETCTQVRSVWSGWCLRSTSSTIPWSKWYLLIWPRSFHL